MAQRKDSDEYTSGEIIKVVDFDPSLDKVYTLQYSPKGDLLAVGHGNGAIRLYCSETGAMKSELRQSRYGGLPVMCIRFHPKDEHIFLVGTTEGKIFSCDTTADPKTAMKEVASEKGNEIYCLDFDMYGLQVATAGKDHNIRIYKYKQMQKEPDIIKGYNSSSNSEKLANTNRIYTIRFHPDKENILLSAGWDHCVKIWDILNHSEGVKRVIHGPHISGDGLDIRSLNTGQVEILTGSWTAKDALQIWSYDGESKKKVKFEPGSSGCNLYCARFCDKDIVLAGGSGTNSVQAINCKTDKVVYELKMDKPIQALDVTSNGRFAAGGDENHLYICKLV